VTPLHPAIFGQCGRVAPTSAVPIVVFRGYGLIELVIVITIIAILGVGLMSAFSGALLGATEPERITRAAVLAEERMELILGRRNALGFAAFGPANFDPCTATPPSPASACTAVPAGYNVTSGLALNWNGDTGYKVITVTVSGAGNAQLLALTADF
jgi:prepilin-type N-terminal cleavage/methylation domain-containing protein